MTDKQNEKKIELENKQGPLTEVEFALLKALGNMRDAEASGIKIVEAREELKVAEKASADAEAEMAKKVKEEVKEEVKK